MINVLYTRPHKFTYFGISLLGCRITSGDNQCSTGPCKVSWFHPTRVQCGGLPSSLVVIHFLLGHTKYHALLSRGYANALDCRILWWWSILCGAHKLLFVACPPLHSGLGLPHSLAVINCLLAHANYHLSRPTHSSGCLTRWWWSILYRATQIVIFSRSALVFMSRTALLAGGD